MVAGRVRHADMWPCTAQERALEEQRPDRAEEEKPRERGDGSSGPRQDNGAGKNEERAQNCKNWSEMMQRMMTTSFNADGGRLEHQEELAKRGRMATKSKTVRGSDGRRLMVVTG